MNSKISCGEMGRSPSQIMLDWSSRWREPEFSQSTGLPIFYTQSGRAAMLLAARLWNLARNDDVLVPAYNCGSEISPLVATGAHVSMYRVDRYARADVHDIMRRTTARTRLIVVIHYFGKAADLKELVEFCREKQIKLIEDCALSLYSQSVGQVGDASIFSFRKSLPVPDGGALVLRSAIHNAAQLISPVPTSIIARSAASLVKKWLKANYEGDNQAQSAVADPPDIPESYYCRPGQQVFGMSRLTLGQLNRTSSRDVVSRRRANFIHLRRRLAAVKAVEFLWDEEGLPDGTCPLGLPVLVADRRRWVFDLRAAGIPVTRWWEGYHRGLDWTEFPEARMLKDRLILLPVHQNLTCRHMDRIGDVMRSVSTTIRQ